MRCAALCLALLPGILACSSAAAPPAGDADDVGRASSAIINGKVSDGTQDAVVLLVYPVGMSAYECSGTLLAPNLVLTARHCVSNVADQPFYCDENGVGSAGGAVSSDFDPSNIYIVTGNHRPYDPTQSGAYAAKGKQIFHDSAKNLCDHDLALILLDRAIPNAQIAPVRLDGPPVQHETFTAIGWGVTSTTPQPSQRQQRAGISVQLVGPAKDTTGALQVPDHEFMVGEAICEGDSGGPAMSEQTNAVFGVVSRGGNGQQPDPNNPASTCLGGDNFYSDTSAYKDLILQAYAASGQDPWPEGGPDPRLAKFGDACTANEGCQSNVCLTDGSGSFTTCTQSCDASNPCPDGYVCGTVNGAAACTVKPPPAPKKTTTTTTGCAAAPGARGARGDGALPLAGLALALAALRRRGRRGAPDAR